MKKLLVLLAGTLAIAGAAPAVSQSDSTATITVSITANGFQPNSVSLRVGDTVMWRNADSKPHRVVSDTNAFPASPTLAPGQTYSFRFMTAGSYSYHDATDLSKSGYLFVTLPSTRIDIGVNRTRVIFRKPVTVFGKLDTRRAESVTVTVTRYGGAQFSWQVTTDATGSFQIVDRPTIRSEYTATWRNEQNPQYRVVQVRPLVILSNRKGSLWLVRVRAGTSYVGKGAKLQRMTSRGWRNVGSVRLKTRSSCGATAPAPCFSTEGLVRKSFARNSRVRAWVPQSPGYLPGFSVAQRSLR